MPLNHYFTKGTTNEKYLYEDLVIEALRIYGHDVYYLPRTLVNKDQLFQEDALSKFDDAYLLEMYMETVEGYNGEKELISRFGLEIRDETTFVVSRRRWERFVSIDDNLISNVRPNEGDWIYMPTVGRLFEISFVDKDDPFYQLDYLPVYKLYARNVEYSGEAIDTDVAAIDAIEDIYSSSNTLTWQITGQQSSTYEENITLERGTDIYSTGVIELEDNTVGAPGKLATETETGFDSILTEESTSSYSFYIVNESLDMLTSEPMADNEWLDDAAGGTTDPVLDFTERNPFGEPTENY